MGLGVEERPDTGEAGAVAAASARTGLVQVYTGDGKGKTTAALGLALRAAGHRLSVAIIQFVKGASYTGEVFAVERLHPDVRIFQFGRDCRRASAVRQGLLDCSACAECLLHEREVTAEDRALASKALATAREMVHGGGADIVVLDEISLAVVFGLVSTDEIVELIMSKRPEVELVLTGRHMPEEILALADLVTDMRQVRHPFERGIAARRGIEY